MRYEPVLSSTSYAAFLPSPAEMAAFDAATIAGGTPSLELMERAGKAVFEELKSRCTPASKIAILCGPGNNGGDGLVIARLLAQSGFSYLTVFVSSASRYSADCQAQLAALVKCGGKPEAFPEARTIGGHDLDAAPAERLGKALVEADCIVDALLGTGQKNPPAGAIKEIVELALARRKEGSFLLAVDIPTGVDADSGAVFSPALSADLTITVELVKRGMLQYPARSNCGKIIARSIGIDCAAGCEVELLSRPALRFPPERDADSHKFDFGRLLVVGGSLNMPGAPMLAAVAALKTGSGLVTLVRFRGMEGVPPPELILKTMESESCAFEEYHAELLQSDLERADALALGPGLGQSPATAAFVSAVLKRAAALDLPLVLDADGLNLIAPAVVAGAAPPLSRAVLTPHAGEMARLLGVNSESVQKDRLLAARRLAERTGAVVVLKGAGSIIYGSGRGYVNPTGTPYLATPGSGDVLTGMIAACLGQGWSTLDAAKSGVFVHGRAGELAHERSGGVILASEISSAIPDAFRN